MVKRLIYGLCLAALLGGCRKIEIVVPTEYELLPIPENPLANPMGMYLLNEGNMGSNKASIDFLDFRTGMYARNIYPAKNPHVVKELGDVGNDIQIYNGRLYAVINCSHKVEVMEARTGVRLAQIDIPNCRYIRFKDNYGYVSSYVGPVEISPNAPLGAVYKIDLKTWTVVDKVVVGYQPEQMEIVGNYMFVANSGGYRKPNYDYTVSAIDLERFRQVSKIPVAINLHRIRADKYGQLWVSSRGDYKGTRSNLFVLQNNTTSGADYSLAYTMNIPCSNMCVKGDSLYLYSVEYSYETNANEITYALVNVRTKQVISRSFITDGTQHDIKVPYGLAVDPASGDIFVTDAKNYVSSGTLHCYDRNGRRKWSVRTGDIPAHMAFYTKENSIIK